MAETAGEKPRLPRQQYRKIDSRIWNDAKFASLSDAGKLVFFLLLTHPHQTSLGAMRANPLGLAGDLGWEPEAFREAFREVLAKGLAKADEKRSFVWLPNFLKYNPPQSANVVKSWKHCDQLIPECDLKYLMWQQVKAFAEGMTEAFREAFTEAFRMPCGIPEPEPKPEPDLASQGEEPPLPPKPSKPPSRKKPKATPPPEFPAELDTPEFREAWADWEQMHVEKGAKAKITPTARRLQLKKCEAMGYDRALAMVVHSTTNAYTGLYEDKGGKGPPRDDDRHDDRFDPMATGPCSEAEADKILAMIPEEDRQ